MNPQGQQTGNRTHEHRDADVISLGMVAVVLLLVLGVCLLVCWGILHRFNRDRAAAEPPRLQMAEQATQFPAPRLLTQPGSELRELRRADQASLNTHGWVDREAGVARIPIRRAMQLLLERGLPEAGAGQTRLQLMQARPQTDSQPNEPIVSPTPEASP